MDHIIRLARTRDVRAIARPGRRERRVRPGAAQGPPSPSTRASRSSGSPSGSATPPGGRLRGAARDVGRTWPRSAPSSAVDESCQGQGIGHRPGRGPAGQGQGGRGRAGCSCSRSALGFFAPARVRGDRGHARLSTRVYANCCVRYDEGVRNSWTGAGSSPTTLGNHRKAAPPAALARALLPGAPLPARPLSDAPPPASN